MGERERDERKGEARQGPVPARAPTEPAGMRNLASAVGNRAFAEAIAEGRVPLTAVHPALAAVVARLAREDVSARTMPMGDTIRQSATALLEPLLGGEPLTVPPRAVLQRMAMSAALIGGLAKGFFTPPRDAKGGRAGRADRGIRDPEALIDRLSVAVGSAWGIWQAQAALADIKINGPVGVGGKLQGPAVGPLVKGTAGGGTKEESQVISAVASGFGSAFGAWQKSVSVPGLPLWPSFAALPGPQAPPTPSIPVSLIQLNSTRSLTPKMSVTDPVGNAVCRALAGAISLAFQIWLPATMVKNVLAKGPVPTYAPPYVPVGPVVMGDNIPIPGHLLG